MATNVKGVVIQYGGDEWLYGNPPSARSLLFRRQFINIYCGLDSSETKIVNYFVGVIENQVIPS